MPGNPLTSLPKQRAFTLLEMLVVLVIAGMATAILMRGLQQVFQLQTHFGHERFNTQQGEMYIDWFRQSVNSLMPDYNDGKNRFKGESRRFGGLTLAPLNSASDALTPFSWQLKFSAKSGATELRYGTDNDAPVVISWPGNTGGFVYYDAAGEAHDTWPPPLGKWPQLPKAIHLETRNAVAPRIIVAAPKGLESPLPRMRDYE